MSENTQQENTSEQEEQEQVYGPALSLAQELGDKPDAGKARRMYFQDMDRGIHGLLLALRDRMEDDPGVKVTPEVVAAFTGLALADVRWRLMMMCKWTGPGEESREDRTHIPEGLSMHDLWRDFGNYSGIPAPAQEEEAQEAQEGPQETITDITAQEDTPDTLEALTALLAAPEETPEEAAPEESKRDRRNRLAREARKARKAQQG